MKAPGGSAREALPKVSSLLSSRAQLKRDPGSSSPVYSPSCHPYFPGLPLVAFYPHSSLEFTPFKRTT